MGYGGKVWQQQRARALRAEAWTLQDIATELGVSKSSVSLWVRDVEFTPKPRRGTRAVGPRRPSSMHLAKLAEIERCDGEGLLEIGRLNDREFLLVGVALYIGEGFKRDGQVGMANTDARVLHFFVTWLRRCFAVEENSSASSPLPSRRARPRWRRALLERVAGHPSLAVPASLSSTRRPDPTAGQTPARVPGGHVQQ